MNNGEKILNSKMKLFAGRSASHKKCRFQQTGGTGIFYLNEDQWFAI
jgi:hypothetical protein